MPARIVVAHDDAEFAGNTVMALRAAGYDVAAFADSMSALFALEIAQRVEVLIYVRVVRGGATEWRRARADGPE